MGKLGDLIVKLKLDGKEYKQGLKGAQKETSGFGATIGQALSKVKVGWVAIAGAIASIGPALKTLAHQNQVLADKWDSTVAGMKSAWSSFLDTIVNADFSNLFKNMREAYALGRSLFNAQDAMGEIGAGRNVFLARNAGRLSEAEVTLRTGKTKDERMAAGQTILDIYKEAESTMTSGLYNVMQATMDSYLGKLGFATSQANREWLVRMIEAMNTEKGQMALARAGSYDPSKGDAGLERFMAVNGISRNMMTFARSYLSHINDDDLKKIETAIVDYYQQLNAVNEATKRVQIAMANMADKTEKAVKGTEQPEGHTWDKIALGSVPGLPVGGAEMATLGLSPQDITARAEAWDEYFNSWQQNVARFQEVMGEFRDACIDGVVNGTQYLTDALFGLEEFNAGRLAQNLLEPLADMAVRQGEILIAQGIGVEACKEALDSLDGWAAIAAGTALIAIGATAKSGLASLASRGGGTTSTSTSASSSSVENTLNSELTVYVKGKISGNDIVISGQRTLNAWSR